MTSQDSFVDSSVGAGRPTFKRRATAALLGEKRAVAIGDRLVDLRVIRQHALTRTGRSDYAKVRKYRNRHAGGRCVIIGNGPSLRETDLSLLRNEITFGLNRFYLMYGDLGFQTTYHVAVNKYVVEQCAADFKQLTIPLFTTVANRPHLDGAPTPIYLTSLSGPRFVTNAAHGLWEGGTVTYVALQLAYYMGFAEVVLVGVDHRFADKGPANKLVVATGPDLNHFDPRYFGPGFKWQLPDLETSEIAYQLAQRKFRLGGRSIIDATVDGALTVFPKMQLQDALGR